ncbi:glycosyl transferase family 2 [Planctomycetales bacterium]|nr:glycosyl transferase family 2 [Planctomycetales bacterium]
MAAQTVLPAEVIVADDGSTAATRELIEKFQPSFPAPISHCWQEDAGFRLATIRNKAVARATADYLVMIDGDMWLHRHFIRDHCRARRAGQFVQGRRVLLTAEKSREIIATPDARRLHWLSSGIKNRLNALCLPALSPLTSKILSRQTHRGTRGCNLGFWRRDVVAVNGFNEAFVGWGREDSEFVARLLHRGVRRLDLRLGGVAYHLFHHENDRAALPANDQILAATVAQKATFCPAGIDRYL